MHRKFDTSFFFFSDSDYGALRALSFPASSRNRPFVLSGSCFGACVSLFFLLLQPPFVVYDARLSDVSSFFSFFSSVSPSLLSRKCRGVQNEDYGNLLLKFAETSLYLLSPYELSGVHFSSLILSSYMPCDDECVRCFPIV